MLYQTDNIQSPAPTCTPERPLFRRIGKMIRAEIAAVLTVSLVLIPLLTSCEQEEMGLTAEQRALIGTPVNFSASFVEPFVTRATYIDNGGFNHGDLMYIYRQYKEMGSEVFCTTPVAFHVYYNDLDERGLGWSPAVGKTGWDKDEPGTVAPNYAFTQTRDSYINWDNDKTVRFRSIFRSNYAGTRTAGKGSYYPDFGLSDWVSAGGPTLDIPLHVSHLGCRIVISPRNGIEANQIERVEICTEAADYKRDDNADTVAHDDNDKWGDAADKAAAVKAVYDRMCMPSGVDLARECLYAMPKSYYDEHSNFEDVEAEGNAVAHIGFATKTPAEVESDIQRPVFTGRINTSCYFITIPYDFSNGEHSGEILTLPPYTRFRVYMYDVNNGDKASSANVEKTYHIFALNDIMDGSNPVYPDGLSMTPGSSYRFRVGYRYKTFTVERDDRLSWTEQDLAPVDMPEDPPQFPHLTYEWWVNVMNAKAVSALTTNNFDPVFDISNIDEFVSCVNLVNGKATTKTGADTELQHVWTTTTTQYPGEKVEAWYDPVDGISGNDTTWVRVVKDHDYANAWMHDSYFTGTDKDYIFYQHYHPQDGDQPAYIEDDYLKGYFPFYDASLGKRFTINFTSDFDLKDVKYPGMGFYEGTKFMGIIEGNMHTVSNAYMASGYLFENVEGATITDLYITSTHSIALVKNVLGDSKTTLIAGVSIDTDCTGASFVQHVDANSNLILVGCLHEGDAGQGLIGTADTGSTVTMMGCMNTGRVSAGGNLCGTDDGGSLAPQPVDKAVKWSNFMCNYYNSEVNTGAVAVGTTADAYRPQEYIRGSESDVLKAHEDLKLPYKAKYDRRYYGYAPWRAMNAAIDYFNKNMAETDADRCLAKYAIRAPQLVFDNFYPHLVTTIADPANPTPITADEGAGLDIPSADN